MSRKKRVVVPSDLLDKQKSHFSALYQNIEDIEDYLEGHGGISPELVQQFLLLTITSLDLFMLFFCVAGSLDIELDVICQAIEAFKPIDSYAKDHELWLTDVRTIALVCEYEEKMRNLLEKLMD